MAQKELKEIDMEKGLSLLAAVNSNIIQILPMPISPSSLIIPVIFISDIGPVVLATFEKPVE